MTHMIRKCVGRPAVLTAFVLLMLLSVSVSLAADTTPLPKPADAVPAPPPCEISVDEQGISVYAVGVEADELLCKLAKATGFGIIIDDTVGRKDKDKFVSRLMTLNLTHKKMTEIVEYICAAYGLSHTQVGKVFMISEGIPKNPSSYLMSDIDSITTKYVLSSKAKSLLPEFLQAHVKVNEGKNAVILSGPTEVLAKFRKDIEQFDVPASQIMIDVTMVEFTNSAAKDLGFDLYWSNAGKSFATSSGEGTIIYSALGTLTDEFNAKIRALVEKKKAWVLANPRIATVSGQSASIFVGRQKYLSEQVIEPDGDYVTHIDAGIKLEMTPWTGGEGAIIADIKTEVSVMSALDAVTKLPEKSSRTATTQVKVQDGETIVIGGLTQEEMQLSRTKIPILGDLPILGTLFHSENRTQNKTELVIFITPRILTEKDSLSPEQRDALLHSMNGGSEGGDNRK